MLLYQLESQKNLNSNQNENDASKYLKLVTNKVSDFSSDEYSDDTECERNNTDDC